MLVIACGHFCARGGLISETAWQGLERVTYAVMVPALLIGLLARADLSGKPVAGVAAAVIFTILAVTALLFLARRLMEARFGIDGPAFTSVLQGAIRWNSFVALSLSQGIGGAGGLATAALVLAAATPLVNVIATAALVRHASGSSPGAAAFCRTLIANPFIWSSIAGLALGFSGLPLPAAAWSAIDMIGQGTLPSGLLLVGAGLNFAALRSAGSAFAVSSALKLLIVPVLAGLTARALGVSGADLLIVLICSTVPTASGSYVLARQMGGDAPLMAAIITGQTLIAIVTMPVMISLLR